MRKMLLESLSYTGSILSKTVVKMLQEIIALGFISKNIEFRKMINKQVNKNTERGVRSSELEFWLLILLCNFSKFSFSVSPSVYRNNKEAMKSDLPP